MCFYIRPIKATRDIKCYKGLEAGYAAPHRGFTYKRGVVYTIPTFGYDRLFTRTTVGSGIGEIHEGFHSKIRRIDAREYGITTVECIIPKGTYYWKNESEYCSLAIKVVKRVKRR